MSNTYYSSLSGMLAASYGLQNTSNNISNMQSHGFKRSDVFYSSLGNGQDGNGHGVRVGGTTTNFSTGNHGKSENLADLAIVGQGFFVIRLKNNELVYTRAGAFEFQNGFLVDKRCGGLVQGYDNAGNLTAIREQGPNQCKGKGSREISINGDFAAKLKSISTNGDAPYEDVTFELKNVYDDHGKALTINLEFENILSPTNPGNKDNKSNKELGCLWRLKKVSYGDIEINSFYGELEFSQFGSGISIMSMNNSIQFTLGDTQTVNVHFGNLTDGSDKSVTLREISDDPSDKGNKTAIQIYENDGYPVGKHLNYSFDQDGQISYTYTNGQDIKGVHVALASVENMEHNLIQTQDNYFKAKTDKGIHYGHPNKPGFSAIMPGYLENSNVDSTTEFANIVVLQRMFQACSQIMDIDKQLLQELESKS